MAQIRPVRQRLTNLRMSHMNDMSEPFTVAADNIAGPAQVYTESAETAAEALAIVERLRAEALEGIRVYRDDEEIDERHLRTQASLERKIADR
jgi:hypothetical protein